MSTSDDVTVRPAREGDEQPLTAFIAPFVEQKRILPRTADELTYLIHSGFIAECDGRIVGFCALEVYSAKLAEIRSLAVDDVMQGRGIGRKLVAACVDRARERGVLEVMAVTSSEEFFKSCGFDFTLPGEKKALFVQTREE